MDLVLSVLQPDLHTAAARGTRLCVRAGHLDATARADRRYLQGRAMLAVLIFAGLRLDELLSLCWRQVDLAAGRVRVGDTKTAAGRRDVTLRPVLRDDLVAVKAGAMDTKYDALVFGTATGRKMNASNLRNRVLAKAVELADERAEQGEQVPLPEGLTPHSMRRTFASLLYAIGEDPPTVMAEMDTPIRR
jgi:integrase